MWLQSAETADFLSHIQLQGAPSLTRAAVDIPLASIRLILSSFCFRFLSLPLQQHLMQTHRQQMMISRAATTKMV